MELLLGTLSLSLSLSLSLFLSLSSFVSFDITIWFFYSSCVTSVRLKYYCCLHLSCVCPSTWNVHHMTCWNGEKNIWLSNAYHQYSYSMFDLESLCVVYAEAFEAHFNTNHYSLLPPLHMFIIVICCALHARWWGELIWNILTSLTKLDFDSFESI